MSEDRGKDYLVLHPKTEMLPKPTVSPLHTRRALYFTSSDGEILK
jgi:hypothetical protein